MPMPFQCIYCGKHVSQALGGICDKCKKEEEEE
jgi:NMD protein affecting ribosome stability and mRNA decay